MRNTAERKVSRDTEMLHDMTANAEAAKSYRQNELIPASYPTKRMMAARKIRIHT
jgi:hypothetical protein